VNVGPLLSTGEEGGGVDTEPEPGRERWSFPSRLLVSNTEEDEPRRSTGEEESCRSPVKPTDLRHTHIHTQSIRHTGTLANAFGTTLLPSFLFLCLCLGEDECIPGLRCHMPVLWFLQ
jgi:hypothetical protein